MTVVRQRFTMAGRVGRSRIRRAGRRGIAAMLAMLYLVIFSALALGFYASVTISSQVAHNDRRAAEAQVAAESGLQFIKYQISRVKLPPLTKKEQRFGQLYQQLSRNLAGSANLGGGTVGYAPGVIYVPAGGTGFVDVNQGGAGFRVTITEVGGREVGENLRVTVSGHSDGATINRALQLEFKPSPFDQSLFDYGVAAMGKMKLGGDFDLIGDEQLLDGSLFSGSVDEFKTPVQIKKKATITGDVYMADDDGRIKLGGHVSIGGASARDAYEQHIHRGVDVPEFPTVDVSVYKPFVSTTLDAKKYRDSSYFANVIIPPNTNPHFTDDVVLEGVIYVQMPNKLTFEKGATVRGVIVYEPQAGFEKEKHNTIEFKQSAQFYSLDYLPVNDKFPQSLHDLDGVSIIAPQTDLKFTGGAGAQFDTILVDDLKLNGHPDAMVRGLVIAMGDVKFEKKASLKIGRHADLSAALKFTLTYTPVNETYLEVTP